MEDWPRIVREHGPMAFETAWRVLGDAADAEDAVQDAFVAALRLHAREAVGNWGALLRHLAGRRALDLLRKRRAAPPGGPDLDPPAPPSAGPEAPMIAAEAGDRLRQALAALPAREAEVFSLRYFGDLTNGDIAAVLDIAPGAVAVALHKARTRLAAVLEPAEQDRRPRHRVATERTGP